jgi:hypothetical protein
VRLPRGISGNYHLFIKADDLNAVFEYIFKNNNIRQSDAPITVAPIDYADLETSEVHAPGIGVASQPVQITWNVGNKGTGITGDGTPGGAVSHWTDRIILSQDAIFGNADDRLIAEVSTRTHWRQGLRTTPPGAAIFRLVYRVAITFMCSPITATPCLRIRMPEVIWPRLARC